MTREAKSAPLWPVLFLLVVYPYLNERPRESYLPEETAHVYVARALVDNFTLRIGDQIKKHGDTSARIAVESDSYAAVSPALGILAAVPYGMQKLAYRIAGSEPSLAATMRWLRLVMVTIPCAVFLLLVYFFLLQRSLKAHPSRLAVLAFGLSAPVWLAAASLSAPLLAGCALFGALMLFSDDTTWPDPSTFLIGGLLTAVAVALIPQGILVAPIVALVAFGRARNPRWMTYYVMPVFLVVVLLAVYYYLSFGHPLLVPGRPGDVYLWNLRMPSWSGLVDMTVGSEGVLRIAPVMGLAIIGFMAMLARGEARAAAVCIFSTTILMLFCSSDTVDSHALGHPGMVTALVFWIWPLATMIESFASVAGGTVLTGVLAVSSLFYAALALCTYPFFTDNYANGLRDVALVLFRDGVFASNLGQSFGLSGGFSLVPLGLLLAGIGGAMALGGEPRSDGGFRRIASVFLLSVSFSWWQLSWSPDDSDPALRHRDTVAIERALTSTGNAETRLQLRARRVESSSGRDTRESRLARGQAATADGDNARAIDSYRAIYRR